MKTMFYFDKCLTVIYVSVSALKHTPVWPLIVDLTFMWNTTVWRQIFTWMQPGTRHHPWEGATRLSILRWHWNPRLHLHPPGCSTEREGGWERKGVSVNVRKVNKSQWKLRNRVTMTDLCRMFTKSTRLLQNFALQQSRENYCISLRQHQGVIMSPKWKTDGY